MHLDISPENVQFLHTQVAAGSFQSEAAALDAAIGLLKIQAEVREKILRGCEQLDRGEYVEFDEEGLAEFFNSLFGAGAAGGSDT